MSGSLSVNALFTAQETPLKLEWLGGHNAADSEIGSAEGRGKRPSLIGYLNLIRPNRIQIVGPVERQYLEEHQLIAASTNTKQLFETTCNIIIFSDAQEPPPSFVKLADAHAVALMRSSMPGHELISSLQRFIVHSLAGRETRHGVFMDVLGIGVLITGESSVGKSELALELVTRGHSLIADDAPEFTRIAHDTVEGGCPPMLRDFLEVRGLGILNIHKMYGDSSTRYRKIIKLIVHLDPVQIGEPLDYDRLSGEQSTTTILEVPISHITIPVAPGRNLAVLVEAGVRNYLLRKGGYNATTHLLERQSNALEAE
ncbi:MAG: HPr(Ser) kinase/phosphatase [Pseudomonadota bacterium]